MHSKMLLGLAFLLFSLHPAALQLYPGLYNYAFLGPTLRRYDPSPLRYRSVPLPSNIYGNQAQLWYTPAQRQTSVRMSSKPDCETDVQDFRDIAVERRWFDEMSSRSVPPDFAADVFPEQRARKGKPSKGKGKPPRGKGRPPKGKGRPPTGKGRPPKGKGRPPKGKGKPPKGKGKPEKIKETPPTGTENPPEGEDEVPEVIGSIELESADDLPVRDLAFGDVYASPVAARSLELPQKSPSTLSNIKVDEKH